jgi:Coenzyme PQQ synthesis protein D (PqqD)
MKPNAYCAQLAAGITLTRIEGKDVLFSVKSGDSYGLNEVAAHMLSLLLETDAASAAGQLAAEYAAPEAEIREDLDELARMLAEARLIDIIEQ